VRVPRLVCVVLVEPRVFDVDDESRLYVGGIGGAVFTTSAYPWSALDRYDHSLDRAR
jgi:hypothetical protein